VSLFDGVWSEQVDPEAVAATGIAGAERDCSQASYLEGLLFGGLDIPNAYTVAERERFEAAEGLPPYNAGAAPGTVEETGLLNYKPADVAAKALYGVTLHQGLEAELPANLRLLNLGLVLSGRGPGLPSGYEGPHSVFFVPLGDSSVLVYDPLEAMGTSSSAMAAGAVLAWHRALPNDIRIVHRAEFATTLQEQTMATPGTPTGIARIGTDPTIRGIRADGSMVALFLDTDVPTYGQAPAPEGLGEAYVIADPRDGSAIALLERNVSAFVGVNAAPATPDPEIAALQAKIAAALAALNA